MPEYIRVKPVCLGGGEYYYGYNAIFGCTGIVCSVHHIEYDRCLQAAPTTAVGIVTCTLLVLVILVVGTLVVGGNLKRRRTEIVAGMILAAICLTALRYGVVLGFVVKCMRLTKNEVVVDLLVQDTSGSYSLIWFGATCAVLAMGVVLLVRALKQKLYYLVSLALAIIGGAIMIIMITLPNLLPCRY